MSTKSVEAWAEALAEAADHAADNFKNETELREALHPIILSAISDLYGLGAASTSAEHATPSGKSTKFYDRLYGGVVVEWEWSMSGARKEHGSKQGLEYLDLLRQSSASINPYTAVVADGRVWGFLQYDPDVAEADLLTTAPATSALHYAWYKNSPAACQQFLELIGSHKQSPITASSLAQRFGPASDLSGKMVTVFSQSMAGRLEGDRTDTLYVEWRRALDVVYGNLDETDGSLAGVVKNFYRVPVLRPVGEYLFVLHTYFALVGRLVAVELLAIACQDQEGRPSGWRALDDAPLVQKLLGLEAGELPGGLQLDNLFEADLFSWWATQAETNTDMLGVVRDALRQLSELAFPQIAFGPAPSGDVLRDLYQSLVPGPLRKALGEFLTPQWLAEACIERVREIDPALGTHRVLDPTCGTGTFLLPILSTRLRELKAKGQADLEQVQAVLDSVCGIDLNPVAVTATRVNYAIALGDLAGIGPLTLPVWRADSILVPDLPPSQGEIGALAGHIYGRLETSLDEPFPIPLSLSTAREVSVLRELIETEILKPSKASYDQQQITEALASFEEGFQLEFGPDGRTPLDCTGIYEGFKNELAVAVELFRRIQELSEEGRNGIWARLIENAFAPVFAGKFDVVIGNPPWLTWTRLPERWRSRTESLWRRYGLWYTPEEDGDSFSLASNDMATLVFAVALGRYVASDGLVALLTPDALIRADPGGRAFRQFHLKPHAKDKHLYETDVPFNLKYVDDWGPIQPFAPDAANKPVFIVAKRDEQFQAPVPGTMWRRKKGVSFKKNAWKTSRITLDAAVGTFSPVNPSIRSSSLSFQDSSKPKLIEGGENTWTFGKGLDTRGANGIYFVSLAGKLTTANTIKITNDPSLGRNKAVQTTVGLVEANLLYPLLRGRDVSPWVASPSGYIIVPHETDDLNKPIQQSKMKSSFPSASRWLGRHKGQLAQRKSPPNRNWNMSAGSSDWYRLDGAFKYMQSEHLVVVREFESRPAAALVDARMDWQLGRVVTPMIDHKLMFCAVDSHEEALYLVANINSTPMQDLLESFVSSISVSPKSLQRLPIPSFDPKELRMLEIAELGKQITKSDSVADEAAKVAGEIDRLIVELLAVDTYKPQPKPAKSKPQQPRKQTEEPVLF